MRLLVKNVDFLDNKIVVDGITEIGNLKDVWKEAVCPVVNSPCFQGRLQSEKTAKIAPKISMYAPPA